MKRSGILLVGVLLLSALAALAIPQGSQALTTCPARGILASYGTVEAEGVTCSKARSLVLTFMDRASVTGDGTHKIRGFNCHNVAKVNRPGIVCRRGAKFGRYLGYPPTG